MLLLLVSQSQKSLGSEVAGCWPLSPRSPIPPHSKRKKKTRNTVYTPNPLCTPNAPEVMLVAMPNIGSNLLLLWEPKRWGLVFGLRACGGWDFVFHGYGVRICRRRSSRGSLEDLCIFKARNSRMRNGETRIYIYIYIRYPIPPHGSTILVVRR